MCNFGLSECNRVKVPKTEVVEFANSKDSDEVAHNEPPHLDLYGLPSSS